MLESRTSPFRIATAAFPPFVNDCGVYTLDRTQKCPYPGIDHEILFRVLAYGNISYQLFPHTGEVNWGHLLPNNSWDGLIGDVLNGKYDTVSSQYLLTEVTSPQIGVSYNIHREIATYIVSNVPNPAEEYFILATMIFRVFDLYSSFGLTGILLILIMQLLIFKRILDISRGQKRFDKTVITDSIHSYQEAMTLLFEGKQKKSNLATRFVFLIIAFTVLLMSTLYQGGLFTIMVTPLNFNTRLMEAIIIDNLEKKNFRLIDTQYNFDNANFYDKLRYREDEFSKRFREILRTNPVEIEEDQDKINYKLTNQYGYVQVSDSKIAAYSLGIDPCDVTWVLADYNSVAWEVFVFRNGSIWQPLFMKNMIMLESYIDSVYDRYLINGTSKCFIPQVAIALSITSVLSAFLLPVMGGSFGIGLLCFELLRNRQNKRAVKYELPLVAGEFDFMVFPSF